MVNYAVQAFVHDFDGKFLELKPWFTQMAPAAMQSAV